MWEVCGDRQACSPGSYAWRSGWEDVGDMGGYGCTGEVEEASEGPGGTGLSTWQRRFLPTLTSINEFPVLFSIRGSRDRGVAVKEWELRRFWGCLWSPFS